MVVFLVVWFWVVFIWQFACLLCIYVAAKFWWKFLKLNEIRLPLSAVQSALELLSVLAVLYP